MSTMLSNQAQIRYVIEWFQEWSEMQRDDFVGILLERCSSSNLVNGLLGGIENLGKENSRPPTIFQCRVKLFREWSQNWSEQEKEMLVASVKLLDPKFAEKYDQRQMDGNHVDEVIAEEHDQQVEINGDEKES